MFSLILDTSSLNKITDSDPNQTIIPYKDGYMIKKFHIFDRVDFYKKLKQVLITFNHDHPKILCIKGLYTDINDTNLKILTLLPTMNENLITRIQTLQKQGERLHKDQIIEYAYTLIDVHEYLQSKGIANGNLKLSNILFNDDGLFVSDVGLRRATDPKETQIEFPYGDPDYLAPEILQATNKLTLSQDTIIKGDIWTVGLIIMEMCLLEKVKLSNVPIELRIGVCLEKLQEFYGMKMRTLVENMLRTDPKKRLSFKESRSYIEHSIFNSMLNPFNRYINPLICMAEIADYDLLKEENIVLKEKIEALTRKLTLKRTFTHGEKIDNYEEAKFDEDEPGPLKLNKNSSQYNPPLSDDGRKETFPDGSPTRAMTMKRDFRVKKSYIGPNKIISIQNVDFNLSEDTPKNNEESKPEITGFEYLLNSTRSTWNEKSRSLSIYFKNQDRGDKFNVDLKNILAVGDQLQNLDIDFDEYFLEERATKELSQLITYNHMLNGLRLNFRDAKKGDLDFKIISQGFNSFSALRDLIINFYISMDNHQAISFFGAVMKLEHIEILKLKYKIAPRMDLEGYSAISKALKEFPKLRHLQIEDLPLSKYELVFNFEGICGKHPQLMILDLKLPTISETAYTFTNGLKKLINLNELRWGSKSLPTGFQDALKSLKHLYSLKLNLVDDFLEVIDIVQKVKGLVELQVVYPENQDIKFFDIKSLFKAITGQQFLNTLKLMVGKGSEGFDTKGVKGFLKKLDNLRVFHFGIHGKLTNKGFASLRKGIKRRLLLEQIKLEFPAPQKTGGVISQSQFIKFCQNLKAIPKLHTLSLLYLDVGGCTSKLFQLFTCHNLKQLDLILENCHNLDGKTLKLCANELKSFNNLEKLVVGFENATKVDYFSFREFVSVIETLSTINSLDIQLTNCQNICDEFPNLARLPIKLTNLINFSLDFTSCKQLFSKGGLNFIADAISRNKSIKNVSFKLLGCSAIPSGDIVAFQEKLEKIVTLKTVSVFS